MIKKSLNEIPVFIAGDLTKLREVLHPKNDAVDLPYSLAWASIEPGEQSLLHVLENDELYIFLKGKGIIIMGEESAEISAGDHVLVPKSRKQYVQNTGEELLTFYCIVSPPWSEEKETV